MKNSCPIVKERVDENLIRLNSGIIFTTLVLFVMTPAKWLIFAIAADFAVRIFLGVKRSPVCFALKKALNTFNVEPCMINAGPKRFAAKLGLGFSLMISLLCLFQMTDTAMIAAAAMSVIVGLEAFWRYCVGCKLYFILTSLGIKLK